jgi:hypothetical protein
MLLVRHRGLQEQEALLKQAQMDMTILEVMALGVPLLVQAVMGITLQVLIQVQMVQEELREELKGIQVQTVLVPIQAAAVAVVIQEVMVVNLAVAVVVALGLVLRVEQVVRGNSLLLIPLPAAGLLQRAL